MQKEDVHPLRFNAIDLDRIGLLDQRVDKELTKSEKQRLLLARVR
jgi:hypothetical protein